MASRYEIEGLVLLLDVGSSMSTRLHNSTTSYLQSSVDIMQMIIQRKMFQGSKDELALVLFGTNETANVLWDGSSDHYRHITVARPLSIVDWKLLEFIQNNISATNLQADVLDGLVVASNHFHEDLNKKKSLKEKRIIILTDFTSNCDDDDKLKDICAGLSKHNIRVDIISPFSDEDIHRSEKGDASKGDTPRGSNQDPNEDRKLMTRQQLETYKMLQQICENTEGAAYSFDEALGLLSSYQSKAIKSAGTKYVMTIGENFKMPIVSLIKCKENKPEMFRFKKVNAKDESVELKIDRARFTKDDEQRDLDDKTDVIDAYRYGSTYVPIDNDPETLRLKVEKCFSLLGFTKSDNVKRYYYLGDSVNQILPDLSTGEDGEEAFVNMVHSMYAEDVCGLVRRVFSVRSSPELGCLIPYIDKHTTCLYYVALPYEDDIRKFTLENYNSVKKFKPKETQLKLVDQLIDSMDLSKKSKTKDDDDDEDEEEEPYDPHLTFNPYIQRMFQSIAMRATNPDGELPDFENHITNTHLLRIGAKVRNQSTNEILKRMCDEFPTKINAKKQKLNDENLFDKKKNEENKENGLNVPDELNLALKDNVALDDLLSATSNVSKVKKIGTVNPDDDFRVLADKIDAANEDEFEDLCLQLQNLIRDFFKESLQHVNPLDEEASNASVGLFQEKSADCIRVQRDYCVRFKYPNIFNRYLKTFKVFLLNEAKNKKYTAVIETFWKKHFVNSKLTLISSSEDCGLSDVDDEQAREFLATFIEVKQETQTQNNDDKHDDKENVEDLLDLM